jgi:hypothetical protein
MFFRVPSNIHHRHSVKTIARFFLCLAVLSLSLTLLKLSNSGSENGPKRGNSADDDAMMLDSWSSASQLLAFLDSSRMTNRSACRIFYEFGGVVINNSDRYKDGQKSVCLDQGLGPAINNCLVYSFGIDNEWSFDDDMAKLGCNVYSFDP